MTNKEQIIIDGKGCRYKTWDAECSLTGDHYGDNMQPCKFIDEKSCYFKQLARKTQELYFARNEVHSKTEYIREQRDIIDKLKQEYEQLQEKYEALKLENQEGYEIVAELKQECEELKKELDLYKTWYRAKHDDVKNLLGCYRKALEEIEKIIKNDFRDDYKVSGVLTLIDSYLTENGKFVDERGDFLKAFEDLLDKEHSSGNKTFSISRQILDIINKAKGEQNDR